MLRLLDVRTGSYAEVSPARPGVLRACAHAGDDAGGFGLTGLRVGLAADVLARAVELRGLQVLTTFASPERCRGQALDDFQRAAEALGIHPPTAYAAFAEAEAVLGGPIDVYLAGGHDASAGPLRGGVVVPIGSVHARGHNDVAAGAVLPGWEHDPLAFRLALLSFPYHHPADLTEDVLASSRETLRRWRQLVARWAEFPSRPIPPDTGRQAEAAFRELDSVAALTLLRGLARDDGVPAGAKFESFAYADRILGLDLARDIGKPGG
jgi:hypothetical protein